jgi:endonuclease III
MAKARSDLLGDVLSLLEKSGGRTPRLKSDLAMDQFIALIFARNGSPAQATKSVQGLREEFVDWNEVRISYVREIIKPLQVQKLPEPKARARELVDLFERFYKDHNAVNLNFLSEMEPEAAFAYLKDIPGVGDAAAAGIVALHMEEGKAIAAPEILRVPGRIGLAGRGATPARIRKFLEDSLADDDRLRGHYLFARLAAGICVSRNPLCPDCPLVDVCAYGQATMKATGGAASRKRAAKKKSTARKKAPAAKKKAAAKKKPAARKTAAKKKPAKKKAAKKTAAKKKPSKKGAKKPAARKKPATKKKAAKKKAAKKK